MSTDELVEATAREYLRRWGDDPETWRDIAFWMRGVLEAAITVAQRRTALNRDAS